MIETYNNIIFYIGYLVVISVFLVLILAMFYEIFQKLMNTKRFFIMVFNSVYEKSLIDLDEEKFYEWHKELEDKYIKLQDKKSK